jgi:hypothetical protein
MEKEFFGKITFISVLVFSLCVICSISDGFAATKTKAVKTVPEGKFTALNPAAYVSEVDLIPLAPRVSDLNGKTVYIVTSMPHGGSGFDAFLERVGNELKKKFPTISVVPVNRGDGYMSADDPKQRSEIESKAAGYIYGGNPTGSITQNAFTFTAKLEKAGKPGTGVIYDNLKRVADKTRLVSGCPVRYSMVPNPPEKMDEKEFAAAFDNIIKALTTPLTADEKKSGKYWPPKPPAVALTGTLTEIQDHFYKEGWTDGLPIIPPTKEKVALMLKGTKHGPDEVVASAMDPEKLIVTVEKVAINGVMAGAKPEYMPALLALAEVCFNAKVGDFVRSTNSFAFMQVVNGPIRKELKMNTEMAAMSPGNQANSVLSRAFTLFLKNLGGTEVGLNMMAVQGNPAYSFIAPENEEKSPWPPLSVEKGLKPGESAISIFIGGWSHVGNYFYPGDGLEALARGMTAFELPSYAVALISPARAAMLKQKNMSKDDVKETIFKNATQTLKQFRESQYFPTLITANIKRGGTYPASYLTDPDDTIVPVYPRNKLEVVVVGGDGPPMMQGWKIGYGATVSVDKWR